MEDTPREEQVRRHNHIGRERQNCTIILALPYTLKCLVSHWSSLNSPLRAKPPDNLNC